MPEKINVREEEKSNSINLKLPYGIAKGLGLNTEGMTPSQVWNMLNGYGLKPKEEYEKFWEKFKKDQQVELPKQKEWEIIDKVENKKEEVKNPFTEDAYTDERKINALNSNDPKVYDKMARVPTYQVWQTLSDAEKYGLVDYTGGYSKYNEPLRGIEYGTSIYKGIENIDFDNIGTTYKSYKKGEIKENINNITSALDKCSYNEDCILRRGCDYAGMDKFFTGLSVADLKTLTTEELTSKMVGKTFVEHGFMSCGSTKGKGFTANIKMSIYAPKGTKMMYVEPVSKFGCGVKRNFS